MSIPWPVADLVPHSGEMVLIDEILYVDADSIVTLCIPRMDGLFDLHNGKIAAWVGIEYMAQTIAAFAGVEAKRAGQEIRLGFLLGTRHYHSNVTHFVPGEALHIRAERSIEDSNGLSVFNCVIESAPVVDNAERIENARETPVFERTHIHVEASINVFQPHDVDSFLRENT